jgi:tetratricopeptide (TPR) repeat protein
MAHLRLTARGWPPALVVLATLAVFLPALDAGFVNWDDDENFLRNPHYRGLGPQQLRWMLTAYHMGHWTPLTWLTLGLDHALWGMDPRGYHLTSLLLHAGSALLVYVLALRLLRRALPAATGEVDLRIGAAAAALLFAVHPLRVESVAWVTERRDVLSGTLFLAAALAYLGSAGDAGRQRGRWYAGALLLFAGALLSKASTLTLPFVLLLLDIYPLRRLGGAAGWVTPSARRVWLEKLPFLALGALTAVVAFRALAPLGNTPSLAQLPVPLRAMIGIYGLASYLLTTLVPLDLSPLYQFPVGVTWLHFAIVIAGFAVSAAAWRRWPAFAAAWGLYVVTLLPVLRLVQGGPQVVADRYSYLACLGWALLAGAAAARRWGGTRVARALLAAWIAALGMLTWQQAGVWHDSVTLWSHAVAVNPESRAAHANLARAHAAEGRIAAAAGHYEETLRLSANRAPYHVIIAELYERAGVPRAATPRFADALRLAPGLPEACAGLRRLRSAASPDALASCPPPR